MSLVGHLISCKQEGPAETLALPPAAPAEIIATVDGRGISADQLRLQLVRRGGDFLSEYRDTDRKVAVLEDLVRQRILAQEARSIGLEKDPEIASAIDQILAERFWRDHVSRDVGLIEIPETDLKSFYDRETTEFREPERARAAVIFIRVRSEATAEERSAARQRADEALQEARKLPANEPTFGDVATRYSDDLSTSGRGGDAGFVIRDASVYRWDPPVTQAIFGLQKAGDLSKPIETARGIFVVKLIERAGGNRKPFDEVAPEIRQRLLSERVREIEEARYADLRERHEVTIHEDVVDRVGPVQDEVAAGLRPPGFPLETDPK